MAAANLVTARLATTRARRLVTALRTPVGILSAFVVALLLILAVVGPILWGDEATRIDPVHLLEGSSAEHPLGTDNLGRDLLARILVATRLSLLLSVLAVLVAAGIGVPLGALPTVLGRRAARATATFIDFSLAFPGILLAIFLGVILGVGAHAAVLAIGVASAPAFARLTQTLAASAAGSDYVAAARVLGVPRWRVLIRHVLPNIAEPLILNTTLAIGYALLALSGLSFIGLGVQPPGFDWGRLLDEALERIFVTPEAALGPASAIVIAGLAFNGLGEALAAAASTRPPRRRSARNPLIRSAPFLAPASTGSVLVVEDLTVTFPTSSGSITPVRGVSFTLAPGELLGIVGESASGKSLTALAIAALVPYPGRVAAARLELQGQDLQTMSAAERRRILGSALAMVFQDPSSSLNPALRIGRQLAEVSEVHSGLRRPAAMSRALDRLHKVRMSSPQRRARQYPHELSGGMRQRAMIGMGLMAEPRLIIADEPTSALDVTVQQQILALLRRVNEDTGASAILISHDLCVVTELCHRVLVMYAGRIVEDLDIATLRTVPAHPYTRDLLASIPDMATDRDRPLATITGRPPDVTEVPEGCAYAPRCRYATERCHRERPELTSLDDSPRTVACWHPQPGLPAVAVELMTAQP